MKLLIKNGRLIDPKSGMDKTSDILIENGKISIIDEAIEENDASVIDAKGKVVAPGFVDIHVHLRQPGFDYKETIKTGTQAAAAGGVTTVACMPNTKPAIHDAEVVEWIFNNSKESACVNVEVVGAITKDIAGVELADINGMVNKGIIAISDDGRTTMNEELMKKAMKIIKEKKLPLISHAEDHDISKDGCMHLGNQSELLGLPGIPEEAEYKIVERDIRLAEETRALLHIAHVSSEKSLDYIKRAKQKGLPVTCEAAPHHFLLNDEIISSDDTHTKVNPPLRNESNRQAMIKGILDGVIDIIATDHAPHDVESKSKEYQKAAFGISGIETMFSLSYTELVLNQKMKLTDLLGMMTYKPAEIIGLTKGELKVGKDADLVLIDIEEEFIINRDAFLSKGKNTPFHGKKVTGKVDTTIVDGKIVYQGGKIKC